MAAAEDLPAPLAERLGTIMLTLGEDAIGNDARRVLEHLLGACLFFFNRRLNQRTPYPRRGIFTRPVLACTWVLVHGAVVDSIPDRRQASNDFGIQLGAVSG